MFYLLPETFFLVQNVFYFTQSAKIIDFFFKYRRIPAGPSRFTYRLQIENIHGGE
jgi:hypothetical protein